MAAANCTYAKNVADPSGKTVTFTTVGAPSLISWRFGDCTDHPMASATTIDHTYNANGDYWAIGLVHATGQRMVMDVGIPSS